MGAVERLVHAQNRVTLADQAGAARQKKTKRYK